MLLILEMLSLPLPLPENTSSGRQVYHAMISRAVFWQPMFFCTFPGDSMGLKGFCSSLKLKLVATVFLFPDKGLIRTSTSLDH